MASGNFLVGDKGLSMQGFMEYVAPRIAEAGYSVPDRLAIKPGPCEDKVLISLVGPGDLEAVLNTALVQAGEAAGNAMPTVWEQQLRTGTTRYEGEKRICSERGIYEVLGVYSADDAASQLFTSHAQQYLLAAAKNAAGRRAREVR